MNPSLLTVTSQPVTHRDYFNHVAPVWDNMVAYEPELENYMKKFDVRQGDVVMDIGAGTGRLTAILQKLVGSAGQVIAGDISEQMLTIGKKIHPADHCQWICADVCRLPFQDGFADKVICYSVFPHIKQPVIALQEIFRVLRSGGKALILHSCCSRKLNQFHAKLNDVVCFDRLPASRDLACLLEQAGFSAVKAIENPGMYWVEALKSASFPST